MTDKARLQKQRATLKGNITRIETFVRDNQNNDNVDVHEFIIREPMLVKAYDNYLIVQEQLEDIDESELQDREAVEGRFCTLLSNIKTIVKKRTEAAQQLSSNSIIINSSGQSSISQQPSQPNSFSQLPLNVPSFSGAYEEWRPFIDIFNALIDKDSSKADSQKLLYLKSLLKGEPLTLISDLQTTDHNYKYALDILKKRYDNELIIVNKHIYSLMNAEVKKGATGLREFIVKIKQNYNALKALNIPVQYWDLILIHIFTEKLDFNTRRSFELERKGSTLPTVMDFFDFIERRCLATETVTYTEGSNKKFEQKHVHEKGGNRQVVHAYSATDSLVERKIQCSFCNMKNHLLIKCYRFNSLTIPQRKEFVSKNRLCYNCLSDKHIVSQCHCTENCKTCKGRHNTLLHENNDNKSKAASNLAVEDNILRDDTSVNVCSVDSLENKHELMKGSERSECLFSRNKTQIILATAGVNLIKDNGEKVQARILLDSGSQSSFIVENVVKKLELKCKSTKLIVSGLGQNNVDVNKSVNVCFESLYDTSEQFSVECSVMSRITCPLPHCVIDVEKLELPKNLNLADERFHLPSEIDLLIGADLYFSLIEPGLIKLGNNLPVLQNSKLGWIIGGSAPCQSLSSNISVSLFSKSNFGLESLEELIPKFWQLEEVTSQKHMTPEDKLSEEIFQKTYSRLDDGSFEVQLPLKPGFSPSDLGDSFNKSNKCFLSLEKRLLKAPRIQKEYKKFIDEYLELGHAKIVPLSFDRQFFSHHCVFNENSETTKLRVVFNASMKTTTGLSVNDILLKGSRYQSDLFDIVCRFRTYKYVLICDIQKMYRMVKVKESDKYLQNILWRNNVDEPIQCIELQTCTYGVNCSASLTTRCLIELAKEGKYSYPLASKAIEEQCYMDDILAGANEVDAFMKLKSELTELLGSGNFKLHKWKSNESELLGLDHSKDKVQIQEENCVSKVLGISWNPSNDFFQIEVPKFEVQDNFTKRQVLSKISQLFDPLGVIGPVVVTAKILMQQIWQSKIDWDDIIPKNLEEKWLEFLESLSYLEKLNIPRKIFYSTNVKEIQIHGFSDSSMLAYGACLYVRCVYTDGTVSSNLVCCKSRVTPLKTISLPRLELCGALLLTRLCHRYVSLIRLKIDKVILWTDSKIVLAWVDSPSARWTIFVANRVSEIQELTSSFPSFQWRHIDSERNPADLISRGINSFTLINSKLWWHGPDFLLDYKLKLDSEIIEIDESVPEERLNSVLAVEKLASTDVFQRFSKFTRLLRSFAYVLRFINNTRNPNSKLNGQTLSVDEIHKSFLIIFKTVQGQHFHKEILALKSSGKIPKDSSVKNLSPFLDKDSLIRIGGRLENADIPFEQKHPILLPDKDYVVTLLIREEHTKLFHAGPQSVLNSLRLRFWPVNALNQIKKIIHNCVRCYRFRASISKQVMGDLPSERVTFSRPFASVGIDFGGPIFVKESRLRKAVVTKAYIALFVCMATRGSTSGNCI